MDCRRLLSRQRALARWSAFVCCGKQQLAGHAGVHQAAGRIETGRQSEGDGFRIHGSPVIRSGAPMRQCRAGALVDLLEDRLPVSARFSPRRGDIGNGAQRHQVAQVFQIRFTVVIPEPGLLRWARRAMTR
jgi:hypothetical protein